MSPTSTHNRQVHQVRLSAPSQDLIWRGQRLLEDALHTASLPAAETSQLLFIRHLNVGTIHSNQSSMSLSVNLEKQIQQLSAIATPGTHPTAAQAPVVSFPDDLAAYSHFAYSLSRDQPLSAWFWPRLLPTWNLSLPKSESVQLLLSHLAAHPLAPFATATVLQQLHKQKALTPFLAILQPEDGRKLLAQNGWSVSSVATLTSERPSFSAIIAHFFSALTNPWPIDDSRTLWLVAMGLIAERPMLAKATDLMAIAQRHLQTFHPSAPNPQSLLLPLLNPNLTSHSVSRDDSPASPHTSPHISPQPKTQTETSLPVLVAAASSQPGDTAPQSLPLPQSTTLSGIHTNYAGLMYVLNQLQYLQLSAYLPQYNNPTFPQQLLRYVAHRLGVPPEDPILRSLPSKLFFSEPLSPLLPAWYSAVKIWTRRHTGLTLKSLIHRPGELALTPTHLDLTFDLNQVDIRIRKAGLDLNPGWLPWFGRVVAFHYEPSREQRSGGTL